MRDGAIATRIFGRSDQERFARLSGDSNPMHMDALVARRTQAGAPVVHGVHALTWGLDALARALGIEGPVDRLRVRFPRFIYLGEEVTLQLTTRTARQISAQIVAGDAMVVGFTLGMGERRAATSPAPEEAAPTYGADLADPVATSPAEMGAMHGVVAPVASEAELRDAFPSAAACLGTGRLSAILGLTRLVGMICPGLHSIFVGFGIDLVAEADAPLRFRVARWDAGRRQVSMAVAGGGIEGTVEAMARVAPVAQAAFAELRALVGPAEFAGSTALVIGGSRGLGALTAKLVAAGGGRVIVTYRVGRTEAEEIAAEIGAGGGECAILAYDTAKPAAGQLVALGVAPTHAYYFATPAIAKQRGDVFDRAAFDAFADVYVAGFVDFCHAAKARAGGDIAIFYPSTVFIDERPRHMTEYAMSKAAGEVVAADLTRFVPGMKVVASRLPRLITDQTAGVNAAATPPAADIMLPVVRRLQAS